jgi:HEPN domain-containing protein
MGGRSALTRTWLEQAQADLRAAEDSAAVGHHEWSCFQAQQAFLV